MYDDVLDNPKIQSLPVRTFKFWINCLCLANKGNPRGNIGTTEEIAFRLRTKVSVADTNLNELRDRRLIEVTPKFFPSSSEVTPKLCWTPSEWNSYQFDNDDPAKVKQRQRNKLDKNVLGHVQGQKINVQRPDTDTEADTEKSPQSNLKSGSPSEVAKPARKPDEAFETFSSEFVEHRKTPYRASKGDFVQLAALKKAFACTNGSAPPDWSAAIHNYLASPMGKYTLADLCSRFDVFKAGKLDRFGKPEGSASKQQGRFDLHQTNIEAGKRFLARNGGSDEES